MAGNVVSFEQQKRIQELEDQFEWVREQYLMLAEHHEGLLAQVYPDVDFDTWHSHMDIIWQNRMALGAVTHTDANGVEKTLE